MYAGHAAVALAIKTRAPRVPMWVLVAAAFGPDWVELFLGLVKGRATGETYSHFIPGVLLGACAAALLYEILFRRRGGRWVAVAWLLHWPADFLTAHKPLIDPGGRVIGLDLYNLPIVDFIMESALVVGCAWLYRRHYAPERWQRRWIAMAAIVLVLIQSVLDYGLRHQPWRQWNPSLAEVRWQPHLTIAAAADAASPPRMRLAFSTSTQSARAQWRMTVPGGW
ncbi:MAG TPA: hypothetical protein VFY85_08455 [Gemmatimonadaceae bacterium]|nr:hypothetical protein [Gemmatimonadaceae bacterium]